MPTCQNCNETWTYKETLKRSYFPNLWMTCPYCEQKQYVALKPRIISMFFVFLILIALFLINHFFGFHWTHLFIYISFILLTIVIYPFWIELSNEERLF